MHHHSLLLKQFRSFCFQNNADDIEKAIEYFAVFGGTGWDVDLTVSLDELIETKVLNNYRYLHGDITKITQSDKAHHSLLSALALGDRREHSAFKRANLSRKEGEKSADFLIAEGLLYRERSQEDPADETEEVSDRLVFASPFIRFWFAFVSPYYKGIKEGDYTEMKQKWANQRQSFFEPVYESLVISLVEQSMTDDSIMKIGSYWDKRSEIEILGQTRSGKIVAGSCKYSKSKANRSELSALYDTCSAARIHPDLFIVFAKSGFSSEFKKEKSATVQLLTLKHLRRLLDDLGEKDLIVTGTKKY